MNIVLNETIGRASGVPQAPRPRAHPLPSLTHPKPMARERASSRQARANSLCQRLRHFAPPNSHDGITATIGAHGRIGSEPLVSRLRLAGTKLLWLHN